MSKLARLSALCAALLAFSVSAFAQSTVSVGTVALTSTTCPGSGCVALGVQGMGSAMFQIVGTGTWTATFEASIDGANFKALAVGASDGSGTVTTTSAAGVWIGAVSGATQIRVRLTSYTSGSPIVYIQAAPSGGSSGGGGGGSIPTGSAGSPSTSVVSVQGVASGTNLPVVCANCSGTGVSVNEDVAFADGAAGTPAYVKREDTLTNTTSADGDWAPLKATALGRLYTSTTLDAALPTGANTIGNIGSITTAVAVTDNSGSLTVDAPVGTPVFVRLSDGTSAISTLPVSFSSLPTGGNVIGAVTQSGGPWSVGGNVSSAATDVGNPVKVGGVYNSTPITLTNAQRGDLQLDANGYLNVNIKAGAAAGGTSATDEGNYTLTSGAGTPAMGYYQTTPDTLASGKVGVLGMTQGRALFVSFRNDDGTGATLASDATANNTAPTTGPLIQGFGSAALPTAISTDGNSVRAWADTFGRLQVTPSGSPASASGALTCAIASAASTNATNCKNAGGNVYDLHLLNTTTTTYYLRFYNLSTSPTCSSSTGYVWTVPIPPAGAAGQVGGFSIPFPVGRGFSAGIGYCITGGASGTDNTSAATGIYGSIGYR
jgi:hypothetical protein